MSGKEKYSGKVHFIEEAKVRNAVKENILDEQKKFSNSATNPIKDSVKGSIKGSLLKYAAFKGKFSPEDI